ncbi:MAG: hypothetical protein ABUS57_22780 [Pseudomonadota bacterium]
MRIWALIGLVTALSAGSPAWAEQSADAGLAAAVKTCDPPANPAQVAADKQEVDAAMSAFQHGGYEALQPRLDNMQRVLDHAPACYPLIEQHGDDILVREESPDIATTLILVLGAAETQKHVNVRQDENVYGTASLLLGSYANEMHHFDDAVRALDHGLALQPSNQFLVLEKATALGQLHRFDEQVALLKAELDSPEAQLSLDRARFERNLGIALIDTDQLDEAEAALNESIRLQPDNPRARDELRYIAEVRAGRVPTTQGITRAAPSPKP